MQREGFRPTFFFLLGGGGGSDQALSLVAPYAHICYRNPIPLLPPTQITANQHQPPNTFDTHCYHSPLMSPTTSIRNQCGIGGWRHWGASVVGGGDGWRQLGAFVIGSGSWWLQWVAVVGGKEKKLQKFFLVPNELKSPKIKFFFCFFPHLGGGWVFGYEANVD